MSHSCIWECHPTWQKPGRRESQSGIALTLDIRVERLTSPVGPSEDTWNCISVTHREDRGALTHCCGSPLVTSCPTGINSSVFLICRCTGLGGLRRTSRKDSKWRLVPARHPRNLHTVSEALGEESKCKVQLSPDVHPVIQQILIADPPSAGHWGLAVNTKGKILAPVELKLQWEGRRQGQLVSDKQVLT